MYSLFILNNINFLLEKKKGYHTRPKRIKAQPESDPQRKTIIANLIDPNRGSYRIRVKSGYPIY